MTEMDYLTVEEAIKQAGLRLVLTEGMPGPWSEVAKALLAYKGLDFIPVAQDGGGPNEALQQWTGQTSAPVLVCDNLAPACHWLDLLMLIERIRPEPALLPQEPSSRALAIGLCALIAGAQGFGWQRRLIMIAPTMRMEEPPEMISRLADKYGYSHEAASGAEQELLAISSYLDSVLAQRQTAGGDYFVGNTVTAVDFYWANFVGMIKPLPPGDNPMPVHMRQAYETAEPKILACLSPRLENHRDMMYQRHIALPLTF